MSVSSSGDDTASYARALILSRAFVTPSIPSKNASSYMPNKNSNVNFIIIKIHAHPQSWPQLALASLESCWSSQGSYPQQRPQQPPP
jgi:hypothetical protein